jgi:predicted RNA-binding protein with TRAM domain
MRHDRGGRSDFGSQNFAPVKVGDELNVSIEAVGEKGDGIAKKDGFVLFVPNTKEGQTVRVKITRVLQKVGFADVIGEAAGSPESSNAYPKGEAAQQASGEPPVEDTDNFGEEENKEE